jgi:hypothetical protein
MSSIRFFASFSIFFFVSSCLCGDSYFLRWLIHEVEMRVITVVGGDLFRVAADELGDATQWIRIAQANGLADTMLSGVTSLRIPPRDPQAGGGIVVQ